MSKTIHNKASEAGRGKKLAQTHDRLGAVADICKIGLALIKIYFYALGRVDTHSSEMAEACVRSRLLGTASFARMRRKPWPPGARLLAPATPFLPRGASTPPRMRATQDARAGRATCCRAWAGGTPPEGLPGWWARRRMALSGLRATLEAQRHEKASPWAGWLHGVPVAGVLVGEAPAGTGSPAARR